MQHRKLARAFRQWLFLSSLVLGGSLGAGAVHAAVQIGIGPDGLQVHYGGHYGGYRHYRHGYRGHNGYRRGYHGYRKPYRRYQRGYGKYGYYKPYRYRRYGY